MATTNKKFVNGSNSHETRHEVLEDYTGDFGFIGSMLIGEIEQKTNIGFKNVDGFETYINAIDDSGYDSGDVIFKGRLYKLNKTQTNILNRSQYGRGTDFKQDIVENRGNNCSIPTKRNCFIKCINDFSKMIIQKNFETFFEVNEDDQML